MGESQVSTQVANWLVNNISRKIFNAIKETGKDYAFADDTYKLIEEQFVGYGVFEDVWAARRLWLMRFDQYPTVDAFVSAFCECANKVNQGSCMVSPYMLTMWMLGELSEKHPDSVDKVLQLIHTRNKDKKQFDQDDFETAVCDVKMHYLISNRY
ncbi:hypothetical protein N7481_000192 [Penicillium waksmanii]|uniref:uncharacterized protein n=1 Tax=Penicillium waksmanii TaxID=69791 RepID=UPI002548C121|nr:uncharacterized protein N7481_000192 [Penicillium waksmanii]KAJ5999783.1 hypothetical protein N7481_000192 [Penicillium waksmanii]